MFSYLVKFRIVLVEGGRDTRSHDVHAKRMHWFFPGGVAGVFTGARLFPMGAVSV